MLISRLIRVFELLKTEGALRAVTTWPKFSLAAFSMISRMKHAGVLPRTVIDVGANVGQFAVASTRLFENVMVIAIEPDSRVADILRGNLPTGVRENILVTAVGDTIGTAIFHVNRDRQSSSLLPLGPGQLESYPDSTIVEETIVPVTTLDALFANRTLPQPILLKIDVQGFEDRVITGATALLTRVDWVLIEVSFSALYEGNREFDSIVDLMESRGFRFVRPMDFHLSPVTNEIIEMDALFQAVSKQGRL
jgi:FkbM family methyltransferase